MVAQRRKLSQRRVAVSNQMFIYVALSMAKDFTAIVAVYTLELKHRRKQTSTPTHTQSVHNSSLPTGLM